MILFRFKVLLLMSCVPMLLVLGGCERAPSELEQYIIDTLLRPGGRIEPLPEIKPYEAYIYQSAEKNARDPFKLFYQEEEEALKAAENIGLSKEMEDEIRNRRKEELEDFELDSLRMVGTMDDADNNWGIILDPSGEVHTVQIGNYMGRNTGKVLDVSEDKIVLREIFKDGQGRWDERQVAILLDAEE